MVFAIQVKRTFLYHVYVTRQFLTQDLDPFEEQEVMLQTCRREGGDMLPISTSPIGRHLPGCLRDVPSALFDSTVKTKGPDHCL